MRLRAVDNLSLRIERGQIYGLLGPNGSGKSTTSKIVLGLLEPTAGRSRVFGQPSARVEVRQQIGYLPESPNFPRFLTGRELLRFYGRMSGLAGGRLTARVDGVMGWAGLTEAADRRVGAYSRGMRQRIGLAQALIHEPELVILDEPTGGLDPQAAAAVTELILKLKAEGRTVLIISHLLSQVEDVCDRIAVLEHGRLVFEGALAELDEESDRLVVVTSRLTSEELAALRSWLAARGRTIESAGPPRARLDRFLLQATRPRGTGRRGADT